MSVPLPSDLISIDFVNLNHCPLMLYDVCDINAVTCGTMSASRREGGEELAHPPSPEKVRCRSGKQIAEKNLLMATY